MSVRLTCVPKHDWGFQVKDWGMVPTEMSCTGREYHSNSHWMLQLRSTQRRMMGLKLDQRFELRIRTLLLHAVEKGQVRSAGVGSDELNTSSHCIT